MDSRNFDKTFINELLQLFLPVYNKYKNQDYNSGADNLNPLRELERETEDLKEKIFFVYKKRLEKLLGKKEVTLDDVSDYVDMNAQVLMENLINLNKPEPEERAKLRTPLNPDLKVSNIYKTVSFEPGMTGPFLYLGQAAIVSTVDDLAKEAWIFLPDSGKTLKVPFKNIVSNPKESLRAKPPLYRANIISSPYKGTGRKTIAKDLAKKANKLLKSSFKSIPVMPSMVFAKDTPIGRESEEPLKIRISSKIGPDPIKDRGPRPAGEEVANLILELGSLIAIKEKNKGSLAKLLGKSTIKSAEKAAPAFPNPVTSSGVTLSWNFCGDTPIDNQDGTKTSAPNGNKKETDSYNQDDSSIFAPLIATPDDSQEAIDRRDELAKMIGEDLSDESVECIKMELWILIIIQILLLIIKIFSMIESYVMTIVVFIINIIKLIMDIKCSPPAIGLILTKLSGLAFGIITTVLGVIIMLLMKLLNLDCILDANMDIAWKMLGAPQEIKLTLDDVKKEFSFGVEQSEDALEEIGDLKRTAINKKLKDSVAKSKEKKETKTFTSFEDMINPKREKSAMDLIQGFVEQFGGILDVKNMVVAGLEGTPAGMALEPILANFKNLDKSVDSVKKVLEGVAKTMDDIEKGKQQALDLIDMFKKEKISKQFKEAIQNLKNVGMEISQD